MMKPPNKDARQLEAVRAEIGKGLAGANYPQSAEAAQACGNALFEAGIGPHTARMTQRANLRSRLPHNGIPKAQAHPPKLTGDRNCCPTCDQDFNSTYAFDRHRVGTHEPDTRRCLSVAEMQASGFTQRGQFWYSPVSEAKRKRLAKLRRKP